MSKFKWEDIPESVMVWMRERMSDNQITKLKRATENDEWIIINGPYGPTGKTTLAEILLSLGYTKVVEKHYAVTVTLNRTIENPCLYSREIFEKLGIKEPLYFHQIDYTSRPCGTDH